ncbi:uncharacterized protein LOC111701107 [Eurytemora carolleeae]|uniref:uncharacterized protein LOC111701107 n=1 Tax=Eurytemora carolleeae TaxID=1294199 RepID=UPI000C75812C|nr:uncharacterized protein LOC111701107 [Eurytemora carolleeae]|eukprot:XP_023328028.1 uncharacterized protein LOC111701107 [Eurytemora affinis]
MFKSETINQLIDLLPDWVCIETVAGEERLVMSEQGLVQNLGRKILELCPEQTEEWIDISTMQDLIFKRSRMKVDISQYQDRLLDKLEFKENKLRRNHQHCVIKNIEVLLQDGRLNIAQIEAEYESKYCRYGILLHVELFKMSK